MKLTTDSTRNLFAHVRSAIAMIELLERDLESDDHRHTFDMGVAAATEVLDAIGREMRAAENEADRFGSVGADEKAWPGDMTEEYMFRAMEPVAALPLNLIHITGERVRGMVTMTTTALRQPELYVYPDAVGSALSAIEGMLLSMLAALEKVRIEPDDFEGSIYRPGSGPSASWPGEAAA